MTNPTIQYIVKYVSFRNVKRLNRKGGVIIARKIIFAMSLVIGIGISTAFAVEPPRAIVVQNNPTVPGISTEIEAEKNFLGWAHIKSEKGFRLVFDISVSYGPISGYMQTPLGGAPSSTSDKRPKFKELDIDMATTANISFSTGINSHYIYGAVHLLDLSGERNLDETLIFHGKEYPAGARIKSDVKLNWSEIGYQYNISLIKKQFILNIAPTVEFVLLDFSGELESKGEKNDRSYSKGTPRIGFEFEWLPVNRFSVSGKVIGALPINNLPDIYTVNFSAKYAIMNKDRLKVLLELGIEYNYIDYKDSQTMPNHIKASIGPSGLFGVKIKF